MSLAVNYISKVLSQSRLKNLILTLFIAVGAFNSAQSASIVGEKERENLSEPKICNTNACKKISAEIWERMNQTVNPCDDFYEYVCGNFSKNAYIPEDQSRNNTFLILRKKIKDQLRESIENEITEKDIEVFQSLKTYYESCRKEELIESNSEKELLEIISTLGGWPVLSGKSWNESSFDWKKTLLNFRKKGFSSNYLIFLGIENNLINNSHNMLFINQANLGIPQEYLSEGMKDSVVQAYFKWMLDMAEILGANRTEAKIELIESLNFEIKLAKISFSAREARNVTKLWNPMTIDEIQSKYPFISWLEYINEFMSPFETLRPNEIVDVSVPGYFESLNYLINNSSKRVLANYAFWRIVDEVSPALSDRVRAARNEFWTGGAKRPPRWQECIEHVNEKLYLITGALYSRKNFDKKSKDSALDMIGELKKSFYDMITKVKWMDANTKKQALEKLENMKALIAYPDELLNDKILNDFHKDLKLNPKSFLENVLNVNFFNINWQTRKLREPFKRDDWTDFYRAAATVNAFYYPTSNSIIFPAGILQEAFFNAKHPKYMNYAGIGSIVGHEMTHGLDDEGRKFDKVGNMVDWWDKNTTEEYLRKADCMINQYNQFYVEEVNLNIDGKFCQGENIADNGGLKEAYYAYEEYEKKYGQEPVLPGFEKFTPKQLFWISNANIWCTKYRPSYLASAMLTDFHPPSKFRIIGSHSNMPEFAQDFNCSATSAMNPPKRCPVW